jgi:hypothetical protein
VSFARVSSRAVVLLRQVLRVGRRLDLLVVVEVDHLLVRPLGFGSAAAAAPRPPARASACGCLGALSPLLLGELRSGLGASAGVGGFGGSS